jgi:4-diphosphocytidyl-2-C-methyl-D-erythritol kinase
LKRRRQQKVTVPAFAKINLGLEVLGLRDDGYHELRTLFQTIDLHDDVVVELRPAGVALECSHPSVPCDARNLAWRAAADLLRFAGQKCGVALTLIKRIPVAGGLGGGSSNAAAVLLALDALLQLRLGATGLYPLARRLGADVPFFLFGGTALGLARGDEIYPLHRQLGTHVVVVDAKMPVSTPAVFRRVDAGLTPRENSSTIFRFVSSDLDGSAGYRILTNELETAALDEAPELASVVRQARAQMRRAGAIFTSLSGSGSSFFGLFDDAASARRAVKALGGVDIAAHRCRTVSLERYRKTWERALGVAGARPTWAQ